MKLKRSNTPINYSAKWKIIVLVLSVVLMLLSALPTAFGEREALHISNQTHSAHADDVYRYLVDNNIDVHSVSENNDRLVVTFASSGQQAATQNLMSEFIQPSETVALTLEPSAPSWLTSLGFQPIKFGLDLRGGVQFLLDVDLAPVFNAHAQSVIDDLRQEFRVRGRVENGEVVIARYNEALLGDIRHHLRTQYPNWTLSQSGERLIISMDEEERRAIRTLTVTQNLQTMRGRIEELGITEAAVQRQGENRIRIELPGVQDPTSAKNIIGATASLAFYHVEPNVNARTKSINDQDGRPVILHRNSILGGEHIIDARASLGEMGTPEVNITLDSTGGRLMSNHSRSHIGNPMATVYSEYSQSETGQSIEQSEVISVATIQSTLGNRFRITGAGSMADAQNLALLLRAGSLTAPVTIVEERTIGPTLGAENVKNGFAALALGLGFTLVFITCWYRRLGWVANVALTINLVCLFGLLALIPGAVLTLPGIAGLVLTVGMAVDTNVLIFERIKNKMREGRNFSQAIDRGFDSAFSSIFDANLTTMIVAIALYAIGNGPIQGFAITLGLGLLTSLFTGVFASRILINYLWGRDTSHEVKL
ncbi:preprotein translocase subunit SecD [Vibrio harveyi]|uniref:protein translocase subunit SecD n=1 Tax=Vibrio harveyi TaxID=669 RepID=UPI0005395833|nr:protein translocase subunit SecD [Vibrio harveyi]AIV05691.1 preprotein translocase subunit SecD [Vibrio harveyi]EKO3805749.1 protein translocase subunit SecD [Vibrio harveyi]EKO3855243.1 protein translocase subunit SecD [Vibrio harveyi]HDM8154029.1 protein translocase subunit SecD [Vibrio harveyi]HDM8157065.1 protein translocase subunit SecD [Vibrio harveyi]